MVWLVQIIHSSTSEHLKKLHPLAIYRIAGKFGREKVWQIHSF